MPARNNEPSSFPPSAYKELVKYEDSHWWFDSRNILLDWVFSSNCVDRGDFLEIGCGSGIVTSFLEGRYPGINFSASDLHEEGLHYAAKRFTRSRCFQLDVTSMNVVNKYDLIGCFDVLEHIQQDSLVLSNVRNALRTEGLLMLTVPQHMFLWSTTDTIACHKRRYNRDDLALKLKLAGFKIKFSTSFVTLLFPALIFVRFFARNPNYNPESEFNLNPFINKFLSLVMHVEFFLIKVGISFPFGGSLLIFAQKR